MARKSSIDRLPEHVKAYVTGLLADGKMTLDELIADLQARFPAAATAGDLPSRSAVGRYGQKLERRLSAIRASTEAAKLIQQHAGDDKDARSEALTAMVQTELFEAILMLQEADEQGEDGEKIDHEKRVEVLSKAAKNIATLTRSSINLKEFQAKVEEAARRKLLEEQQAKAQELTRAGVPAQEVLAQVIRAGYGL